MEYLLKIVIFVFGGGIIGGLYLSIKENWKNYRKQKYDEEKRRRNRQ